jgi:Zn-dependent M28 family amino/carboxypeptidase
VANLNFDMFLPLHPMKSVIAFGLEESSLRQPLEEIGRQLGLEVLTDPEPQRNRFIRSDQYSFIQKGIPALALKVGFSPGTPEAEIQRQWTANRYHAVGDDLAQPIHRDAAAVFNTLVARLAASIADAPDRPRWNQTSFFRRFAEQTAPAVRTSQ